MQDSKVNKMLFIMHAANYDGINSQRQRSLYAAEQQAIGYYGHIPQFQPMTGLLNEYLKKNHLGRSANQRVYGCGLDHEDAIWVSNYSYGDLQHKLWGFENLNFMQSNFFCRNNGTTPPCWYKTGNGVKFGLTSSS